MDDPEPLELGERWEPPAGIEALPDVLARVEAYLRSRPTAQQATAAIVQRALEEVPDLRTSDGRMDAPKIAEQLGIPVAALPVIGQVRAEGVSIQTDEEALASVAHVIAELRAAIGDQPRRLDWLRQSRHRWAGLTALDMIESGRCYEVAHFLSMIRDGGAGS